MELLVATLILAAINVAGFCVMAYFNYKTNLEQQKTTLSLAMFKKSIDPFQVRALQALVNDETAEESKVESDPMDEETIPDLSDEARANLRSNL